MQEIGNLFSVKYCLKNGNAFQTRGEMGGFIIQLVVSEQKETERIIVISKVRRFVEEEY